MKENEAPKPRATRTKKTATTARTTKALPERTLPEVPAQPTITGTQPERVANETF